MHGSDIAVITGNGLSIAQNPDLSLTSLTEGIRGRIDRHRNDGQVEPSLVLRDISARAKAGDPECDFEALLGPLDTMTEFLEQLDQLSKVMASAPAKVSSSIGVATKFVEAVHRVGLSHVLQVISERSVASFNSRGVIEDFMVAVMDAAGSGKVVVGNLNYDLLEHAVLADMFGDRFCDMAYGYNKKAVELVPGWLATARPLRHLGAPYPPRQLVLLHLHGSLSWLRGPDGRVYRFTARDIRNSGYFDALRSGSTEWTPEVVLTNQDRKSALVQQEPFSWAYGEFKSRLDDADRWVIVGYSFKDECVNDMLKRALLKRIDDPPKILVVTQGADPSDLTLRLALGWLEYHRQCPPFEDWVRVERTGVGGALRSVAWRDWVVANGRFALPAA